MQTAKIKALEKLIAEACERISALEKENAALEQQNRNLSRETALLSGGQAELRKLRHWRDSVKSRLEKLSARLARAADKYGR